MAAVFNMFRFKPMAHRSHASKRFWFYNVVGFSLPVILLVALPETGTLTDELAWLSVLAPAFLLPLHYGLKGSVLALLIGALMVSCAHLLATDPSTAAEWYMTAPILIACTAVAFTVGWFSGMLDEYFRQALATERMVAIGQLAVTVNHRANNALAAIVAESGLLLVDGDELSDKQRSSINAINKAAMRIAKDVRKIGRLRDSPIVTYAGEIKMIDLEKANVKTAPILPSI